MKKILALLCAVLLLAVSCASAEGGTIVEFRDKIQLNGVLPEGYHFSLISQADDTLEGQLISDNAAAPVFEIYIAFNDSYAQAGSLKDLDQEALGIIRQGFENENEVTFGSFDTASGDGFLLVKENSGLFLDFYTICLGYEIELTLFPADGQALSEAQISQWTEFVRTLDILPIQG